MLFVDDDESEVIEGYIVLEQGMGTDNNLWNASANGLEQSRTRHNFSIEDAIVAREKGDTLMRFFENFGKTFEMLSCQNFGRREERCL